jgi:hypothetical protein
MDNHTRVQTGVRMEKRLVKVLKALGELTRIYGLDLGTWRPERVGHDAAASAGE